MTTQASHESNPLAGERLVDDFSATTGASGSLARWRPSTTVLTAGLVVCVYAVAAWQRRWMNEDGLIVGRVVRQILAGNGPNYNYLQRDEVDTSVLWTWLGTAVTAIFRGDVVVNLVVLGLVLSVAGLGFALAGSTRFHRAHGADGFLAPAGALLVVAVAAFWDFATSGLETGLSLLWLGLMGWLLSSVSEDSGAGRVRVTAVVTGLGPLVRPDLALASVVFGTGVLCICRPGPRRALGYIVIGAALPVAYEVFRAGYYGITVPMPALAKEASSARWGQGVRYFTDFYNTYTLVIPHVILCVLVVTVFARRSLDRRATVCLAAPLVSGALMGAYIVRVGGDYMHGRMWIPVLFTLLLPVMLIPVGAGRRVESAGVALLAVWALFTGLYVRTSYDQISFGPDGILDARDLETHNMRDEHPMTTDVVLRATDLPARIQQLTAHGDGTLIMHPTKFGKELKLSAFPLAATVPDHDVFFFPIIGIAGVVAPLDMTIVDGNGLATPLAGHLRLDKRGTPGHEKGLSQAWAFARYVDPATIATITDDSEVTKAQVWAARHALSCGELKELMDSVDAPMDWSRFWTNLRGAVRRTSLRVPPDPFEAERQFCG